MLVHIGLIPWHKTTVFYMYNVLELHCLLFEPPGFDSNVAQPFFILPYFLLFERFRFGWRERRRASNYGHGKSPINCIFLVNALAYASTIYQQSTFCLPVKQIVVIKLAFIRLHEAPLTNKIHPFQDAFYLAVNRFVVNSCC